MIVITTGKKSSSHLLGPACSNYDRKKKIQSSVRCYAVPNTTGKKNVEKIIYEKKNFTIYRSCTVPIVVWPSFVAPFQLPLLRRSNYDRKKKIQLSVRCYTVPNTTEKKKKSGGCTIVITTGKKSSSRLSGGCMIVITTGKKSSSHLLGPAGFFFF